MACGRFDLCHRVSWWVRDVLSGCKRLVRGLMKGGGKENVRRDYDNTAASRCCAFLNAWIEMLLPFGLMLLVTVIPIAGAGSVVAVGILLVFGVIFWLIIK